MDKMLYIYITFCIVMNLDPGDRQIHILLIYTLSLSLYLYLSRKTTRSRREV